MFLGIYNFRLVKFPNYVFLNNEHNKDKLSKNNIDNNVESQKPQLTRKVFAEKRGRVLKKKTS